MRSAAANAVHVGQIVKLAGETGIGKSWLVRRFLDQINGAAAAGVGHCVSLSSPRPLAPLAEMSDAFGPAFGARLTEALTAADPIGRSLEAITGLPPGTTLIFEDVHEADALTYDLLRLLCRRIADTRLLLIMTFRPATLAHNAGLKEVLAECPTLSTTRINVPPLGAGDVRQLCRQLDAQPGGLVEQCGGNPYLLVELATSQQRGETRIPPAIAKSTARYLRQLSPEQRAWVELLAIVPPPHAPQLVQILAQALGLRLRDIPADCELLETSRNLDFRASIQRDAVLEDISEFRRMELERDVLAALFSAQYDKSSPESCLKLALTCDAAPEVARLALTGALAAEARGDIGQCVSLLERALPYAQAVDADQHTVLLEAWACRRAVLDGITEETLARVRRNIKYWEGVGRNTAAASTCLLMARLHHYRAEQSLSDAYVERALERLENQPASADHALALAYKANYAYLRGDAVTARTSLARARKCLPPNSDLAVRLHLLLAQAQVTLAEGKLRGGFRLLQACHKVALAKDLHELAAKIQIEACDAALHNCDLPRADAWAAIPNALGDRFDANCWKFALTGRRALVRLFKGALQDAVELANEAISKTAPPAFVVQALVAHAGSRGRLLDEDVDLQLQSCLLTAQTLGDVRLCALVASLRAEGALLRQGAAATADLLAPSPFPANAATDFCDAMLNIARHRAGTQRDTSLDNSLPDAVRLELDDKFAEAASAWMALGNTFEAAMALSRLGAADDGQFLRAAFDAFEAIGATSGIHYVQRLAAHLDVQLGGRGRKRGPYRGARTHPLGLTRREVDILKMIVAGASNRDIAARLNRSLRTIEHHVSNILGKMSMESRVQAALHAITNPAILENADEVHDDI